MRKGIIIQARQTSQRLPGKVLMPLHGVSLVGRVIQRANAVPTKDLVIVAIPDTKSNDDLAEEVLRHDAILFRGSEDDVLGRFYRASEEADLDIVVRATADNAFIDPFEIDSMLARLANDELDYISNINNDRHPLGNTIEVFTRELLIKAHSNANLPHEIEHVTPYMYSHPEHRIDRHESLYLDADIRLTIDQREDYELISWIYDQLSETNPVFSLKEVYSLYERFPDRFSSNLGVEQRLLP